MCIFNFVCILMVRFPVHQENFLRQGVKEFPHVESTLFKMLGKEEELSRIETIPTYHFDRSGSESKNNCKKLFFLNLKPYDIF